MRKYLATFAGVAAAFFGLLSAHAQSAFSNALTALNPVAYWPLNETAAPPGTAPVATNLGSLSSAFNAAGIGSVTFGVPGALAGSADTAAGFDGVYSAAITPYGSGIANGPSFTIEAWLLSHNIGATQCPLSDVDANSPRSGWLIYMDVSNPGQYTFRGYDKTGTSPSLSMNIGAANSILQDQWYHLVVVVSNAVTATNVYAYINGVLAAGPTALPTFVPNDGVSGTTFAIGDRSDNSFFFDGAVDEVAYYTTALDPSTIAAHYSNGTNVSPGTPYNTLISASAPALYFRLDQPAAPVAHNYGSLGAAANGYYQTGTVPGAAGPSFGAFANGFGSSDFATQFSPGGTPNTTNSGPSVVCAPSNPGLLNYTNSITVAAWVKVPAGTNGWFAGVLSRGDNSFRFAADASGMPHFADGGNADIVGANALNDGRWHYWVGTYDSVSGNAVLYIDSVSAGNAAWTPPSGSTDNELLIGGAPDYTGRNFPGEVAQVAIFTSALSVSQIQGVYNSTAPSPFTLAIVGLNPVAYWPLTETAQPPVPPTFGATNLGTVGANLDGTFNGDVVFGVAGALSTTDSADGFNGSTTSLVTPYTADIANGPSFTIEAWLNSHNINATQCPLCDVDAANPRSGWLIYMDISNPGQYTFRTYDQNAANGLTPSLTLNIGAAASVQQDQWNHLVVVVSNAVSVTNVYAYLNGVLAAGPTVLPTFVPNDGVSPATFAIGERSDGGFLFDGDLDEVAYYTNALDAATVLAHYQAGTNPSPATAYNQLVLQKKPIIYFRLDEAPAGSPYPVALPVAANYGSAGASANGIYEAGTTPGVPGPFGSSSHACMFTPNSSGPPAGTSGPGVLCDPYDLTALNATNALTVSAWVQVPTAANTLFEDVLSRSDGAYRFSVDTTQLPHWAAAPNGDITGTSTINDGNWHLWTGVYNPATSSGTLYIDGLVQGHSSWSALSSLEQVFFIGGAPDYTGTGSRAFSGSIGHVAIFTNALTQAQIQQAYASIGVPPSPPIIVQQPAAAEILLAGATLQASVAVTGPGPFSYHWYFNTTSQITNATNATLTLANLQTTNGGNYSCSISNRYGSTPSTTLSLTVIAPTLYGATVLSDGPLAYFPLNESSGTTAYDVVGGDNGVYSNAPMFSVPGPSSFLPFSVGFDGTSQSVLVPDSPALDFGGFTTLEAWIEPSNTQPSGVEGDILAKGYDANQNSDELQIRVNDSTNFAGGFYDSTVGGQGPVAGTVTTNWQHLVLTWDGSNWTMYVNALVVGTAAASTGPVAFNDPWGIADGTTSGNTRLYSGNICAAAIYDHALTPTRVRAHYNIGTVGTTNVPPIVTVPAGPITVDQGAATSIASSSIGPEPFFYHWYYTNSGSTVFVPGGTNATLQLTSVQPVQANYQYFVVVSNAYGAVTSSYVMLNVLSGVPVIVADLVPLLTEVPAGTPVSFSVAATGTEPFTYQWFHGSGAIAGATNTSYSLDALAGANNYSVTVSNADGSTPSSTAVVVGSATAPPIIGFNGNGANWTLNMGNVSTPTISNNVLQLTFDLGSEADSAFYNTPQYIGGFIASFIYQIAPESSVADGVTFCLQNAPAGAAAVGGGGGALGYNGISNSAAFEMNVYTGSPGSIGIQFGTNGETAATTPATGPYASTAPVNLNSTDPIYIQLYYEGEVLSVAMVDAKLSFNTNYVCNLPAIVDGSSAFVGFTGGDGSVVSRQTVSDFKFSYTTPPILALARGTPGSVVVSWPVSVSTLFGLQESTGVDGPWSNVTTTPVIVNSENQVTLTPGTKTAFFRLALQ